MIGGHHRHSPAGSPQDLPVPTPSDDSAELGRQCPPRTVNAVRRVTLLRDHARAREESLAMIGVGSH
jgi:hypothetical protein